MKISNLVLALSATALFACEEGPKRDMPKVDHSGEYDVKTMATGNSERCDALLAKVQEVAERQGENRGVGMDGSEVHVVDRSELGDIDEEIKRLGCVSDKSEG